MEPLSAHLNLLKLALESQDKDEVLSAPLLTHGVISQFASQSLRKKESFDLQIALLGGSSSLLAKCGQTSHVKSSTKPLDPRVFMNVSHPSSVFICGSQGSGKSHTLSCLLENCLLSSKVGNLRNPLTALVFHRGTFISDDGGPPCEAAHLASESEISVRVLCSPTNENTIRVCTSSGPADHVETDFKASYANLNVTVEPLRLSQSDLNTQRMLDLMAVRPEDGQVPLYIQTVTRILRKMRIEQQTSGARFRYLTFKKEIESSDLNPNQLAPLKQRLDALESFMDPDSLSQAWKKSASTKAGTNWSSKPGELTIVDLSCPCITSDVACGIFNICLSIFLEQDPTIGRVVALDEARKYMDASPEASAFTESLLSSIRLQRHLGVRIFISTQEPTISPKLLDLSSLMIVHRFTSPEWLNVLQRHIAPVASNMRVTQDGVMGTSEDEIPDATSPVSEGSFRQIFEEIVHLRVGEALLFSPSALIEKSSETKGFKRLGFGYMRVQIRNRLTDDGGKSILAL